MTDTDLVARQTPIVPLDTAQVTAAMQAYQKGLQSILDDSDYQTFDDKDGDTQRFVKRSGFRKIAAWFNLDLEIVQSHVERNDHGHPIRAEAIARARHPNGRFADGDGRCSINERRFTKPEHDLPSTATTRAMNRAISNLVGMGAVSAEELDGAAEATSSGEPPVLEDASGQDIERTGRALMALYNTPDDDQPAQAALDAITADLDNRLPRIVARAIQRAAQHRPGTAA